jgi:predicted nuclease of predicted toxin-antitoxin system
VAEEQATKLALDEDVRTLLARLLRNRGHDVVSVLEVGRGGASDSEQLAWATANGRVLVTHNVADFARLATQWTPAFRHHAGLLLVRQAPLGALLREVLRVISAAPLAASWTDQLVWASSAPNRPRRQRR